MNASHRRGACPGLTAPMLTGDGLLVRFAPADRIALDAFTALCAAARRHGNGTLEISARGSLQVRGLSARSAPAFALAVGALAIAAVDGVSVIVDPLADDPDALIDGHPATVDDAVEAAADYLLNANMPLVYGMSNITCEAQREAVSLAELVGGVVDSHTSL